MTHPWCLMCSHVQKLKSLKNYCLELDWYKPTEDQMARRCLGICSQEGLSVNESTLKELCRTCNGDVRLVLGQLQMLRLKARSLTYDQVKGRAGTSKDADMSPFECARRLMDPNFSPNPNKPGGMTTSGRLDFYFADADLVPLLVQENYLNHRPVIAHDEQQRMRAIAKAADCLSQGDVMNTALRKSNNWTLMPAVAQGRPDAWLRQVFAVCSTTHLRFPQAALAALALLLLELQKQPMTVNSSDCDDLEATGKLGVWLQMVHTEHNGCQYSVLVESHAVR
ncbi:DNA polymerase III, clamp loader complex, gamma/delta/delta subunit, partial [Dunaliella salina]